MKMDSVKLEAISSEQKRKFSGPSNTITLPIVRNSSSSSNSAAAQFRPFAWTTRHERTQLLIQYLKENKFPKEAEEILLNEGVKQHNIVYFPQNENHVSKDHEYMDSEDEERYSYRESDPFAQQLMKTTPHGNKFEVLIPGHLNGEGNREWPYTISGFFPRSILEQMQSTDSAIMQQMEPIVDLLYEKLEQKF
jgi:hypothetical protein